MIDLKVKIPYSLFVIGFSLVLFCSSLAVFGSSDASQLQSSSSGGASASSCESCFSNAQITVKDINAAQAAWGNGLVAIGKSYAAGGDYTKVASELIDRLYAYNYDRGIVLFNPTKASVNPFRGSFTSALSYFVGSNPNFVEDTGFALEPWTQVVFHNDQFYTHGDMAIVMGQYDFTDKKEHTTRVDYTFAYVKTSSGDLKIVLQHSSLPFN